LFESISVFTGLSRPVGSLVLGRRDVADRLQQAAMVEPVQSFQGGVLDVVDALPGTVPQGTVAADQLGLVETDDRLGQGVVGVAARAHRELHAGLGEALRVADREVLAAAIGVVDEALKIAAALPERHLQGVEGEVGAQRARDLPAAEKAAVGIGASRKATRAAWWPLDSVTR